jgi:CheY-like chemotaxis protein
VRVALIVEDNPLNMELMEDLLTIYNFIIYKSENAEDAEELLKDIQPDVIFLDIQLPGMDGISLAKKLLSQYGNKLPALVAVTAHAIQGDAEKILEAGFHSYLPKPIDFSYFKELLSELKLV